ncbi:MAG: methylenetetrahydrofolate reductase [NAD(P)H] [Propionibacteriaceae bacterium]|jgi:methylenetetrahydrofolate reductase (NADPH)|nr:methylenetetrahydrofolate reductase [NAD(P)H] [Propionibacteriaceae bacterium]
MSEFSVAQSLAAAPTMSFEFFPPKTDAGLESLRNAVRELEPLKPDFVSVTYGASGSTRDRTLAATRFIQQQTSVATMGHLTCVGQTADDLRSVLGSYAKLKVRHILALRGDPSGGPTAPWHTHPGGLANATELVRLAKAEGDFSVGVAAFPDAHPEHHDFELDARILLDKQEAGAEFAITQLFFRAESYFALVRRLRRLGCTMPVIAGIMPVTDVSQVERFAQLSGAEMPAPLANRLREVAGDPQAVAQVGLEIALELCRELLAGGAPGLHFFTQNRSTATKRILAALNP